MKQHKLLPAGRIYEVEIIYKQPVLSQLKKVTSAEDVVRFMRGFLNPDRISYKEFFWVLLLNRANYIVGVSEIGNGTVSSVLVNRKEIFQLVLRTNASGIILVHNHPSGNIKPSSADEQLTREIDRCAALFDTNLVDHIVITSEAYFSFADVGLLK